ncbi:hypothetical protein KVR01_006044 [Diaporthe batatas]|uniref:uncharacterized protein n=1 Tax=Diaporthe batatas TaxID=748121 RepID=UPI001D04B62D|nr:uncharacterized protein KVR01_006044 [Diaporthe batatas]KAG8164126.1 hypothetical protein KVR01_006044 [Diaporthe batatas]
MLKAANLRIRRLESLGETHHLHRTPEGASVVKRMRLLDVSSLQIQSGFDDAAAGLTDEAKVQRELWGMTSSEESYQIPPYAILSHRWVGREVVFGDFDTIPKDQLRNVAKANPVPKTTGAVEDVGDGIEASIYKIAGACEKVRQGTTGVRHIWIDTVCIYKNDITELSSALNSMFNWYHAAAVCYVYLFDVTWNEADDPDGSHEQFVGSKWFTRGWTLQELLAPKDIEFYDRDWQYIGSKQSLVDEIVQATRIAREHLLGDFRTASIAQKMSWLSDRVTTKIEDRAYCMLGLFGVFLDPRYGRGGDEFLRLQLQIFIETPPGAIFDESMFAWKADLIETSGLLAPAPSCFRESGQVLFEPRLAKSQRTETQMQGGMVIDQAMGVDFHIPWAGRKLRRLVAFLAAHLLTCGIAGMIGLLINLTVRNTSSKPNHLMNLNCWVRGPDQKLRNVRIKVVQDEDKFWRRIECNEMFESDNNDLFSQADAHGSQDGGRVSGYFPHRIMYKVRVLIV